VATPKLCVVNKMDAASRAKMAAALQAAAGLADFAEIVPVSARTGDQLDLWSSWSCATSPRAGPCTPRATPATSPSSTWWPS
jgi:GTP-binding protein Era